MLRLSAHAAFSPRYKFYTWPFVHGGLLVTPTKGGFLTRDIELNFARRDKTAVAVGSTPALIARRATGEQNDCGE